MIWRLEYVKAVYCHPAYLTYMQGTSCKMPGWVNHKPESRSPGETSTTSDMQTTPLLTAASEEAVKSLLMRVNGKSEKAGLNERLLCLQTVDIMHETDA